MARINKKYYPAFIGISIVLVIIIALSLHCSPKKPVTIGALLALTGISKDAVIEIHNGITLAVDEINKNNGINGRPLKILVEDTQSKNDVAIEAFNELEKKEQPLFYISTLSSTSVAIAPYTEKNKVPLICTLTGSPRVTEGREWIYRYNSTTREEAVCLISMFKRFKIKKIASIHSTDEWGQSLHDTLTMTSGEALPNLQIIDKSYKLGHKDFNEIVSSIIDAESVCLLGFSSYYKKIIQLLKKMNYQGYIFTGSASSHVSIYSIPSFDGVYSCAPVFYKPNYKFAKQINERFHLKFNKELSHYGALGYDTIKIMTSLLEDKEISRENLKNICDQGFIYTGLMGIVNVQAGNKDFTYPLEPVQIKNGKLNFLE